MSPDLPSYFIFRVLTAFQGTSFLVVGSSAVGDIFEQRKRATALVWVLSGSMVGPAIGPFIGVCYYLIESTVSSWLTNLPRVLSLLSANGELSSGC